MTEIETERRLKDVTSTASAAVGTLTFYLLFTGVFGIDSRLTAVAALISMWAPLGYLYFTAAKRFRAKRDLH